MTKILTQFLLFLFSFFSFGLFVQYSPVQAVKVPYCDKGCGTVEDSIGKIYNEVNIPEKAKNKDTTAASYIQEIVSKVLGYLFLICVIIIIYAGAIVMFSIGDEEKLAQSKKIILFAIIGLIVIYLAGPITRFIIDALLNTK